ncbi:Gsa11p [Coccidioides immitis RMSCC 3703]|uniref:Autophagy-related protein 2 n=1 Tax=Coccidioides immitis RMSCC 3703 TaxID=454286 RepID=A0A0J8QYB4_COCIT|nr:Gsa11p [Coccidioides immitis RMSCC 3703]
MVHLEILNVKPVPDLAASEVVLKATVLPLRLHVDQDALDFLSRFFEFKDDSAPSEPSPEDVPFLQRAEVNAIRVRLDFKPKRVDYAGLRSGRTTEFMNFFVLDEADMVLQHVIIYGVSGFDRLGRTLNDIWMPDIKANQLPTVLAGIAPVRSLVNIGGGVKDLVLVPMREYKKDGRIVRSIQKGTQTALQSAEDFLNSPRGSPSRPSTSDGRWDDNGVDEGERPRISLYADQPLGVAQGLRGAYSSLERDILMTRDAIVAMPSEVLESGSATEAARRLLGRTPTVVLRPAIGASKAVSQTLLGVSNALDPKNRRKIDDKYKKHKV